MGGFALKSLKHDPQKRALGAMEAVLLRQIALTQSSMQCFMFNVWLNIQVCSIETGCHWLSTSAKQDRVLYTIEKHTKKDTETMARSRIAWGQKLRALLPFFLQNHGTTHGFVQEETDGGRRHGGPARLGGGARRFGGDALVGGGGFGSYLSGAHFGSHVKGKWTYLEMLCGCCGIDSPTAMFFSLWFIRYPILSSLAQHPFRCLPTASGVLKATGECCLARGRGYPTLNHPSQLHKKLLLVEVS